MKKLFLFLLFLFAVLTWTGVLAIDNSAVNIYFFWGDGCPHCEKEKLFLGSLKTQYDNIEIYDFEIWRNAQNRRLLTTVGRELNADISGVPLTVVGNRYFIGYYNDATTGRDIEEVVKFCLTTNCPDLVAPLAGLDKIEVVDKSSDNGIISAESDIIAGGREKTITLPLLGEINALEFSLPLLTIIIGGLDGFNPCAMWALLFLISLLLGMKNKKRMWILGLVFIITSALVYFVFMAAWLNLILFIGLVFWIRVAVGLLALSAGAYNFKKYFSNPSGVCQVVNDNRKQKFFDRFRNITTEKSFYLALGGIILLALAVNLIELLCSAGLPVVYTQILALNNLSNWQYYLYLTLYIFVFMLDDLFVFFVAMTTLRLSGLTNNYSRWSHLIGGILMLVIGLLLLFKPEFLMFG